ncbi:FtsX-like permease family [Leminorella richardii]|uniref:FtsX-like permease family n=1 Tax=Leminorella richardii TaxID=158841 RepID=A0A2X4V010_9GAMM|nr:FtsX-like permease family protein [Leminorella richardii]SQI38640.1 FtsX-like permease family [Leminorella richardii]
MILLKIIFADLKRLWGGAALLIVLIAAAVAFSVVVNLQERALREGSARAADRFDLLIGAAGSETQLVLSSVFLQPSPLPLLDGHYLDEIKSNPLVEWAAPLAFGDTFKGMSIIGTEEALFTGRRVNYAPRPLPDDMRVFQGPNDAIVGAATGLSVGDKIVPLHGQQGSEGAHSHDNAGYTVTGILDPSHDAWDNAILVPIQAVWDIHHEPHDREHGAEHDDGHDREHDAEHEHEEPGRVSAVVVKPKSIAGAYQLRSQYRSGETLSVFPGEVLARLYGTLGDARQIMAWVAVGTQALVIVAILMVIVIHLEQRKRQLGALRAFGAPRRGIVCVVWAGLMLIVSAGIALGVIVGYVTTLWISARFTSHYGMALPVTLQVEDGMRALALWGVLAAILLFPALLTYRYSPAQALRG